MGNYTPPSFDIISYEIEDIITLSVGDSDPNGGDGSDWWG